MKFGPHFFFGPIGEDHWNIVENPFAPSPGDGDHPMIPAVTINLYPVFP